VVENKLEFVFFEYENNGSAVFKKLILKEWLQIFYWFCLY
jgi:hypothetical protein